MEYLLYRLRPQQPADRDRSVPAAQAVIPAPLLAQTDLLNIVMNLANPKLREDIFNKKLFDFKKAHILLNSDTNRTEQLQVGSSQP